MTRERIYPVFLPFAGCPHRCVFCEQQHLGPEQKSPSPDAVHGWLASVLPERGGGEIAFYGGTFTLLPQHLQIAYLETARGFVAAGRVSGIRVSTRPDAVDVPIASALREGGVTTVELGCQSFADPVLALAGRGHKADAHKTAVTSLKRAGLLCGIQLMPGLPGASKQEALYSLDEALSLEPAFLRIYPTVVLRDTSLARAWGRGEYRPWTLEEAVRVCAEMLLRCRRRDTPVIRLGLQGSARLEGGSVLAGPYHPAFGQLVASRLWLRALLAAYKYSGTPNLSVHPHDLADARGHRNFNLLRLKQFISAKITLCAAVSLPRDHIGCGRMIFSRDALLEAVGVLS